MNDLQWLLPGTIKTLSVSEKAQWPVSIALAADDTKIVVSRHGDAIWDFWPYIPQENKADSGKRVNWAIKLRDGECLTDPEYAMLLESCKDFIWSLFADPIEGRKRPKMSTITGLVRGSLAYLVRWMTDQGMSHFSQLKGRTLDYVAHAKQGVCPTTANSRLSLLESIYHQSGKMAGGLTQHPWEFETAAGLSGAASMSGRYKPQTPLIPEVALKRLSALAIEYVERRATRILDVRDAIADAGGHRVFQKESRACTVVAQSFGFKTAREHTHELAFLKTACYIVIGLFSGIRNSELLSLGMGCIVPYRTKDGIEARWLHGTIYKTGYRPKKWLVPPIIETAVRVMERLSAPMRSLLDAEEQFLINIEEPTQATTKRLHKVQRQKEKLFLSPESKAGNRLSVMSGGATGTLLKKFCQRNDIRGNDGEIWPLASHQFRRTFAYNYAKSEMGDLLYLQEHLGHHSLDMTLLYSDEGTDSYEADTELLEMIAQAKHERQVDILKGVLDSDAPLAAGEQWIGDWRRTIRTAKNKEELIEDLSGTLSLTGTGHSWCAGSAKGTGCGSRCMFEPDMCTECSWAIISQEHLPVWREIARQQEEILACVDIGIPGQALARRVLGKAKETIAKLEGTPK